MLGPLSFERHSMAETSSGMARLGSPTPPFLLPDTCGKHWSRETYEYHPALLVAFICNHCPYVVHLADGLAALAREFSKSGLGLVAINPNDVDRYPDDSPEKMIEFAAEHGFDFPYLFDESQFVAQAFKATCTPDFFLYDEHHRLYYRGCFDDARPGNDIPVTGRCLREAIDALLSGRDAPSEQSPSVGCSIKWKT